MGLDTRKFHGSGGDFLEKKDVIAKGGRVGATISGVDTFQDKDSAKTKLVIVFGGSGKRMTLNQGNLSVLEDAYGFDTDGWVGKSVEIYHDESVRYAGKKVGGLKLAAVKPSEKPL